MILTSEAVPLASFNACQIARWRDFLDSERRRAVTAEFLLLSALAICACAAHVKDSNGVGLRARGGGSSPAAPGEGSSAGGLCCSSSTPPPLPL